MQPKITAYRLASSNPQPLADPCRWRFGEYAIELTVPSMLLPEGLADKRGLESPGLAGGGCLPLRWRLMAT